ncbi:Methyltransferase adrK [Drechslerella dactyloides]|uniref:Methyltransferase adrK n=1 Tax=Drechslerella dactyloides TaxID=74499 RepID=A0AAD6J5X5_DREDA|nr:Methyltransferase adrK [Drechslerella dactyloides]
MASMENTDPSKTTLVVDDKSVSWYDQEFCDVRGDVREVLVNYAHIAPENIHEHVMRTRDKAWEVAPYPCIGKFWFLVMNLHRLPCYPLVLSELKNGAKFLDLGSCMGQDVRRLVYDGAPGANIVGVDIKGALLDLGYELWRDRETLAVKFLEADIFDDSEAAPLRLYRENFDFIHLGMIFHLFTWKMQVKLMERCIMFLKPQNGSMIMGQAVGRVEGGDDALAENVAASFRHSADTFKKLMEEVQEKTGIKFEVRADIDEDWCLPPGHPSFDPMMRRLVIEVKWV